MHQGKGLLCYICNCNNNFPGDAKLCINFIQKLLFSKQLNLSLIDIYHLRFLEHTKKYVLYIIFHYNTFLEISYFIQQHSHEISNRRTEIIAILLEIHKSMHRIVFNRITQCYFLCKDERINKKTELINHQYFNAEG